MITSALGLQPQHEWKVGDPRRTPKGKLLAGVHSQTYWTARIWSGNGADLPRTLLKHVIALRDRKDFFDEFARTGGEAEYFVGWYAGGKNTGAILRCDLLSHLAMLHINLALDVYGK